MSSLPEKTAACAAGPPRSRLWWLGVLVAVFAALVLMVTVAGAMLPLRLTSTAGINIARPPESVWSVVTDFRNVASWQPGVESSEILTAANPLRWKVRLAGHARDVVFEVEQADAPRRLVQRVVSPGESKFRGRLVIDVAPTETGCRVNVTADGEIDNPFLRFLAHVTGRPAAAIRATLTALKREAEKTTRR